MRVDCTNERQRRVILFNAASVARAATSDASCAEVLKESELPVVSFNEDMVSFNAE
jgi:hypothetical protein